MAEKLEPSTLRRTMRMPGLKPSDYRLFQQIRQHFDFSMRQLLVLGMRWLYAGWHDPTMRGMIMQLAAEIAVENLDKQLEPTQYKRLEDITQEIPR